MADLVIYNDGELELDVSIEADTIWLTQKQIAELFEVTTATINEHIKNIFANRELSIDSTIRNFLIVRQEGKRKVKREVEK